MARVTVEDCLKKVDNRFGLIHLSAKRVRQLRKGAEPLVVCKNSDIVVSLREIAAGEVFQLRPGEEGYVEEDYLTEAEDSVAKDTQEPLDEELPVDEKSPAQDNEDQKSTIEGQ